MKDKSDKVTKDMFARRKDKRPRAKSLRQKVSELSLAYSTNASFVVKRLSDVERGLAAHIDRTASNLQILQKDVKYAVENVNAIMGRVSKYGPPAPASVIPGLDVFGRPLPQHNTLASMLQHIQNALSQVAKEHHIQLHV